MNATKSSARLYRRVQGGSDPIVVFRELVGVPCVTFSEYRLYQHLHSSLDDLRAGLSDSQLERLTERFTPAGQLLVSWRGRPESARRAVLVAHVDREGFLVKNHKPGDQFAICWHTAAKIPDEDKIGSPVKLLCSDCTLSGHIERMSEARHDLTAENPFDHEVVVKVDREESKSDRELLENPYFDGIGHYAIPSWNDQSGMIEATHVDNTAGVSVIMSVMSALVRNNWRVNADFLFTTCEEAGFCGIMAEILEGSILRSPRDGDVICFVVDSSSHTKFLAERQLWEPAPPAESDYNEAVEIPLQNAVIRTGDRYTIFDYEVAKLLHAAATNLQSVATKSDKPFWAGRGRRSLSEDLRSSLKAEQAPDGALPSPARNNVLAGRLLGGWCEATPLQLERAIRGRRGDPPLGLRVGSVAIPIAHYRNFFRHRLEPEKCHQDALRSACQLLGEAVRLCHRWPFGLRDPHPAGSGRRTEELVDKLMGWQDRFALLSSVNKSWINGLNRKGAAVL